MIYFESIGMENWREPLDGIGQEICQDWTHLRRTLYLILRDPHPQVLGYQRLQQCCRERYAEDLAGRPEEVRNYGWVVR